MISIPVFELVAGLLDAPVARIEGDASVRVSGPATLQSARSDHIAFLANPQYRQQLSTTSAGAVIVSDEVAASLVEPAFTRIVTAQPYLLYAKVAQWFERALFPLPPGRIHPSAVVDPSAQLGEGVDVGPLAVIEAGAVIQAHARIGAGAFVGQGCEIGASTVLHPRSTLYPRVIIGARGIVHSGAVLGADGFGFAPHAQGWEKIPQFGRVRIGDDVEIGANTSIDRGALDDTAIEDGAKLDNHIQLGHNVRIGERTAMAGCTGVAGSTVIGRRCMIGGASIIIGHIEIADEVHLSAGTVVMGSIKKAGRYTGVYPIDTHRNWEKNAAVVRNLAEVRRRLRTLESES